MKGMCLIETRIDEETTYNNRDIEPSLIVYTNMYSIGRVLTKNFLMKHNSVQKKIQFNEGDDLYNNAEEERQKINDRDNQNDMIQGERNFSQT